MKFYALCGVLAVISGGAMADVDYSRCGIPMGVSLDNDGKLKLFPGQKIKNKTTEGKVEKYVLEYDTQAGYGFGMGMGMGIPSKMEITLERDDQGRVIKSIVGAEKLDKKSIEAQKKATLQMQTQSAITMSMGLGGISHTFFTGEPVYPIKTKEDKIIFKRLTELDKSERSQLGLSEDLYKEMNQKWRKDKKAIAKIEKGLKLFQDKSNPSFYLGQEAEFDIKDGVCTPKIVNSRYFNSADGSVTKSPLFSKEACEEVSKLYQKHKDKISKCEDASQEADKDLYQNLDKIKDLSQGAYGFGMGPGHYGGIGSPQTSQLSKLKATCDAFLGEFTFFPGNGKDPKEAPASSTAQ